MAPRLPGGLYAITPDDLDIARQTDRVARALDGGIDVLQLRVKGGSEAAREDLASALKALCDAAGVPLIVNDDLVLALRVGAAGLHIGREDGEPRVVRERLGPHRLLGVSCYDSWERAEQLAEVADHVGWGSVFASATKPQAVRAPLGLFERAHAEGRVAVAIGGIDRHNAHLPIEAGAHAVAVITDLFGQGNPTANARALKRVIEGARQRRDHPAR